MPTTPNFAWPYPVVGADLDTWGNILNATGNLIDAEMFKKANAANPVFTGVVTAPAFVGDPIAVLRPKTDAAASIQFQNAAGTAAIAWIDTPSGDMSVTGNITTTLYRGNPSVILRPFVDGINGIRFERADGTLTAGVDTVNGRLKAASAVFAPLFSSDTAVAIRPSANSATAINLQNAGGAIIVALDTTANILAVTGAVTAVSAAFRTTGAGLQLPLAIDNGATGVSGAGIAFRVSDSASVGYNSAGRIYGVFDTPSWAGARITLQSQDVSNTPIDTLSVKNGCVGIKVNTPSEALTINAIPYAASQAGGMMLTSPGGEFRGRVFLTSNAGGVGFLSMQMSFTGSPWVGISLDQSGNIFIPNLPTAPLPAGSKGLWCDTADGNRVKYAV